MHVFRRSDGSVTSVPVEMRLACDFYSALYAKEVTEINAQIIFLKPACAIKHKKLLDSKLTFE